MSLVARITAFGVFFKRYARTWQHAVATAALTAFGMLTFVNGIFAVIALLAYVLPPLVIYARSPGVVEETTAPNADDSDEMAAADRDRANDDGSTEWSTSTWGASAVPTEETLTDVAVDGEHAYAVGTAGTVLRDVATGGRQSWWTAPMHGRTHSPASIRRRPVGSGSPVIPAPSAESTFRRIVTCHTPSRTATPRTSWPSPQPAPRTERSSFSRTDRDDSAVAGVSTEKWRGTSRRRREAAPAWVASFSRRHRWDTRTTRASPSSGSRTAGEPPRKSALMLRSR
jgi:hypothetical protein